MPQGLRKEQLQLIAALLRDPEYWKGFMQRAHEPLFLGGPAKGAMVPGLGSYQMTTDAMDAYRAGDQEAAIGHAFDAATQVLPLRAVRALSPVKGGTFLPIPGFNTTATDSPERAETKRQWETLKYDNPALKPEAWKDLPKKWWLPDPFK